MGCTMSKEGNSSEEAWTNRSQGNSIPKPQFLGMGAPGKDGSPDSKDLDSVEVVLKQDSPVSEVGSAGADTSEAAARSGGVASTSEGRGGFTPLEQPSDSAYLSSTPVSSRSSRDYRGAPLPVNEAERTEIVCSINHLDQPPDARFDDITKLLCQIFRVPVAIVTLVEKDRQYFRSVQGLPVTETSRSASFCAWTLLPTHHEVLVVPDALEDIRFADNPLVTAEPHIRFYAGAPLVSSTGHRLGSLCIIDRKPRTLDAESCNVLCNFAEVVIRELEKDRLRELERIRFATQTSGLMRAMNCFTEGIMVVNSASADLHVLFLNMAWTRITGVEKEDAIAKPLWDIFDAVGQTKEAAIAFAWKAVQNKKAFTTDMRRCNDTSSQRFSANFRPAAEDVLDEHTPQISIPGSTAWSGDGLANNLYFVMLHPRNSNSRANSGMLKEVRQNLEPEVQEPFHDVRLGPLLGQGSFGKVYRGLWNGAHVAVKIIQMPPTSEHASPSQSGGNSDNSMELTPKRMQNGTANQPTMEALLTMNLSHPNIVNNYKCAQTPLPDISEEELTLQDRPKCHVRETWIIMEYCDRGSLQEAVDKGVFNSRKVGGNKELRIGKPNMLMIRRTAKEIASAMAYLHSQDILHGDLCGGNILLCSSSKDARGFVAKVADFGLARRLSAETIQTGTYGTVTHMPPELLTQGRLSKRADVYAFGVLLWEMYTGQRPWSGLLHYQVIFNVTIHNKALAFPEDTPPAFRELAEVCMSKDASRRPKFNVILKMLDDLGTGEGGLRPASSRLASKHDPEALPQPRSLSAECGLDRLRVQGQEPEQFIVEVAKTRERRLPRSPFSVNVESSLPQEAYTAEGNGTA